MAKESAKEIKSKKLNTLFEDKISVKRLHTIMKDPDFMVYILKIFNKNIEFFEFFKWKTTMKLLSAKIGFPTDNQDYLLIALYIKTEEKFDLIKEFSILGFKDYPTFTVKAVFKNYQKRKIKVF